MSLPEEQPKPEEPAPSDETPSEQVIHPEEPAPSDETPSEQVIYPEETALPEDFTPLGGTRRLPRARRRRAHRMWVPPGADERSAILSGLARKASPSYEFFLFSLLCGAVLGAGYLFDLKMNSQAVLLLGILLAPILTPWVGMTVAAASGSWRFFFMSLGSLLVAGGLVFLSGGLAGLAGRLWLPQPLFFQADIRTHIWWLDLFIVVLGAALLAISFIRSEQKPILPSIMLAYGLFMPLSAAGFGLGIGETPMWQNGLQVSLLHLALATFVGVLVMLSLRFKPRRAGGYILLLLVILVCLAALVAFTGLVTILRDGIIATRSAPPTPTATLIPPSETPTLTRTATPTLTPTATDTPSASATATPAPEYSVIASSSGGGALVRSEPGGGTVITVLSNGIIVQVLPEIQNVGGSNWVRVLWNDVNGWVLTTVLTATTATPATPPTPTLTPTP